MQTDRKATHRSKLRIRQTCYFSCAVYRLYIDSMIYDIIYSHWQQRTCAQGVAQHPNKFNYICMHITLKHIRIYAYIHAHVSIFVVFSRFSNNSSWEPSKKSCCTCNSRLIFCENPSMTPAALTTKHPFQDLRKSCICICICTCSHEVYT